MAHAQPIPTPPDTFDEPWKLILEHYFRDFLTFLFPTVATAIDWSRPPEPMPTELTRLTATSSTGPRRVDWLVKVWLRDGTERWLLIHIEIQSQPEEAFPYRLAMYHFHLRITSAQSVLSLAVLGDDNLHWRPDRYVDDVLGLRLELIYPMVKLVDFREREEELRQSQNPIAVLVRAHLATLDTRHDLERRKAAKLALFRDVLRLGYTGDELRRLFDVAERFLKLPRAEYEEFRATVATELGAQAVDIMNSFERYGLEQGLQQGLQQGQGNLTLRQLTRKFGALPEEVAAQIRALDSEQMLELAESLLDFTTFADLTAWLADNPPASATDAASAE
ncbi:MAG: DUF4351 domain-containing protein [Chloroflexaceae bacterium]|nr:DUF4351 domain-containing protein [Chloroflexaceae bacterium]